MVDFSKIHSVAFEDINITVKHNDDTPVLFLIMQGDNPLAIFSDELRAIDYRAY